MIISFEANTSIFESHKDDLYMHSQIIILAYVKQTQSLFTYLILYFVIHHVKHVSYYLTLTLMTLPQLPLPLILKMILYCIVIS